MKKLVTIAVHLHLVSLLIACGEPNKLNSASEGVNLPSRATDSTIASDPDISVPAADAGGPRNSSGDANPKEVAESPAPPSGEENLPAVEAPQASAPISVGGAYLICSWAADLDMAACGVWENNLPKILGLGSTVSWALDADDGASLPAPVPATRFDSGFLGTLFYVSVEEATSGTLIATINDNLIRGNLSFDLAKLPPKSDSLLVQSMPVSSIPNNFVVSELKAGPFVYLGDTLADKTATPCLTPADRTGINPGSFRESQDYLGTLSDTAVYSIYLKNVCGLADSSGAKVKITGPNNLSLTVSLTPGVQNHLLVRNLPMAPGKYTAQVITQKIPGTNNYEDFKYESIVILSETPNTAFFPGP